ncbi:tRNA(Ile)-lysidine synthase [Marinobacterium mangrovicola]|uniref:tRNA(Ile)-lysidine synthase n=1 Tax=Marinobacterium mangrovicola TaxID=1476959 RepID=A0A4R1GLG5_9GAMM|nr:tRNA(Ile)-lysidine synthase [Marinobacterium mangrovicola]
MICLIAAMHASGTTGALSTDLAELLLGRLERLPDSRRWVIALSGGVDSRVLLELCARTLPREKLLALHINHQLQADAGAWQDWCASECQRLGVAFTSLSVDPGSGSEAELRDARYRAFESVLKPGDWLLLAQHADDQAETFLLRLLRGAGVRGLSGMPWQRPVGQGQLYRPLMDQPRAVLEAWARQEQIEWVEDPSNASDRYDRNWIRQRILAPLKQRKPAVLERLVATTAQLAETDQLLDEIAAGDLAAMQTVAECLPLAALQQLSLPRQRNLIRHWVFTCTGDRLSQDELLEVEQSVIAAGEDRTPLLRLGGFELRRYRGQLFLTEALAPRSEPFDLNCTAHGSVVLAQGVIEFHPANGVGLAEGETLRLDYRRGGERLRPLGRGGSVSLKQLLQEAGVPPWLRPGWPILYRGDQLVAVPGICLCEEVVTTGGLIPSWRPSGLSEGVCFGRL